MASRRKPNPLVEQLEIAFDHINQKIYQGQLKLPAIVVQPDKKVLVKFVKDGFHLVVGGKFTTASRKQILSDLLHEMVHIHNHIFAVVDRSVNSYHNKEFQESALEAGLFVGKRNAQGWSLTSIDQINKSQIAPVEKASQRLHECLDRLPVDWDIVQSAQREIRKLLKSPKVCFLKYVCGCPAPHNSIRSGRRPDGIRPLHVLCNDCGELFECEAGQL